MTDDEFRDRLDELIDQCLEDGWSSSRIRDAIADCLSDRDDEWDDEEMI